MKLNEKQLELLRKPLPKEAVSKHPTKTYLSSIKAIYVVERLNDVFGIGNWNLDSVHINTTGKMVVVQSTFECKEYNVRLQSYGGNDNVDLGDAYKGATTDALTKIGSMLEIGMDVFKGLSDVAPTKEVKPMTEPPKHFSTTATELPPLSDKAFAAMLEAISKGDKDKVKSAMSKYTLLKPQLDELTKLLN